VKFSENLSKQILGKVHWEGGKKMEIRRLPLRYRVSGWLQRKVEVTARKMPEKVGAGLLKFGYLLSQKVGLPWTMGGISEANLKKLKEGMTPNFLPIQKLGKKEIRFLTSKRIENLSPKEIRALTPRQIKALTPSQVEALTEKQILALRVPQLLAFTGKQLEAFNEFQYEALANLLSSSRISEEDTLEVLSDIYVKSFCTYQFLLELLTPLAKTK
jgi:hypothetical protein